MKDIINGNLSMAFQFDFHLVEPDSGDKVLFRVDPKTLNIFKATCIESCTFQRHQILLYQEEGSYYFLNSKLMIFS